MAIQTCKATINGVLQTLTYNSSTKKWEASINAPSTSSYNANAGHFFDVSITATDDAGNVTTVNAATPTIGASLKLYVKERVKPVANVISPGAGAFVTNSAPPIEINLTDNDSGINISTLAIKINGGAAITNVSAGVVITDISGGKKVVYTPQSALADGNHTITVDVSDNDGNAASQGTRTFKIDTVPPSLNVTSPANALVTNQKNINVIGSTNDVTSSPVSVSITVNGTDVGAVTIGGDGSFTKAITLIEGANTIVITACDGAGKTSTVTRSVSVNTIAPQFKTVSLTPNPVDAGATYVISVEFV